MFCKKCGSNIPDNSAVCPNCGEPVQNSTTTTQPQTIIVQQVSSDKNGMAIAGFVLSLLAALSLGLSFIFELLGLIFSIMGLSKAKSANGNGKGLAIAGIVLAAISIALLILYFTVLADLLF